MCNRNISSGTKLHTHTHTWEVEPQQMLYCMLIGARLSCTAAVPKSYQKHSRQRPSIEISSNRYAQQSLKEHKALRESSHLLMRSALCKILTYFISNPSCDPLNRYSGQSIRSLLCLAATKAQFDLFWFGKRSLCWCDSVTDINFPSFRSLPDCLKRFFCRL